MNAGAYAPQLLSAPDAGSWRLPKGVVGMTCLIIAESAIFTIFVVAYLFYLGKSLAARRRGKSWNCRF